MSITVHTPVRSRDGYKTRAISIDGRHVPGVQAVSYKGSDYSIYSGSVLLASAVPGRQIEFRVAEFVKAGVIK